MRRVALWMVPLLIAEAITGHSAVLDIVVGLALAALAVSMFMPVPTDNPPHRNVLVRILRSRWPKNHRQAWLICAPLMGSCAIVGGLLPGAASRPSKWPIVVAVAVALFVAAGVGGSRGVSRQRDADNSWGQTAVSEQQREQQQQRTGSD